MATHYVLNATNKDSSTFSSSLREELRGIAVKASLEGLTEKGLKNPSLVKETKESASKSLILNAPIEEPFGIEREENHGYFVKEALRKIFSNGSMAFGSGVVLLERNILGQLVQKALSDRGVKTMFV